MALIIPVSGRRGRIEAIGGYKFYHWQKVHPIDRSLGRRWEEKPAKMFFWINKHTCFGLLQVASAKWVLFLSRLKWCMCFRTLSQEENIGEDPRFLDKGIWRNSFDSRSSWSGGGTGTIIYLQFTPPRVELKLQNWAECYNSGVKIKLPRDKIVPSRWRRNY